MMSRLMMAGAALALAACSGPFVPVTVRSQGATLVSADALLNTIPLVVGVSQVHGVTVEPDTGRRLVLADGGAIHELLADGVVETPLWRGQPAMAGGDDGTFTDLVALGDGQVALSAASDGFVVDLGEGSLRQHFCYEPGWFEGRPNEPVQLTRALAFDPVSELIFAQPRTIENAGWGETTESFISAYDEAGGEDLAWWDLDERLFTASGMAVLDTGRDVQRPRLILGSGDTLYVFDADQRVVEARFDLTGVGVHAIDGVAIDREADSVLVVDAATSTLRELSLSALGL